MQQKIEISSSIKAYHESCNYLTKIKMLQNAIDESMRKSQQELKNFHDDQQEKMTKMYQKILKEMETEIQEKNNERSLQTIQQLMYSIKEIEDDSAKLNQ